MGRKRGLGVGLWLVGADTLARSRFAVSPLAETVACLKMLIGRPAPVGAGGWPAEHRAAYHERVAADPFAAAFAAAAFRRAWMPGFLTVPPRPGDRSIDDELDRVRATTPAAFLADLAVTVQGPLPEVLTAPDGTARVAGLLAWVWRRCVEPDWPRRSRTFEADVVARTQQLSSGGWAAALDGMRPGMRWLGDGRLQINTYDHPPRDLAGAELVLVPATVHRGWVASDPQDNRFAVVYPCSGLLAPARGGATPEALARLLGPVRAGILAALDTPKSTTQLVALTGRGWARSVATCGCCWTPDWSAGAGRGARCSITAAAPATTWSGSSRSRRVRPHRAVRSWITRSTYAPRSAAEGTAPGAAWVSWPSPR